MDEPIGRFFLYRVEMFCSRLPCPFLLPRHCREINIPGHSYVTGADLFNLTDTDFNLTDNFQVVLEEDGTIIDGDEFLPELPKFTYLLILMPGEKWSDRATTGMMPLFILYRVLLLYSM